MKDNYCVDTQSDKFQFHINQAILILKLNDSELKRETLKNLLYMKFAGSDLSEDDSDAPLTLALDAMRYLTDKSLRHLTSYRLLVNVLPSLMIHDDMNDLSRLNDFINQNGLFSIEEVINLQRCGVIHEMSASVYSLETFANYTHSGINLSEYTHPSEENIIFANSLTPAGVIITDITLGYFLNLKEQYNHWLPIRNKSLHVNDLIVDKDAHINQNMIVRGDTASGGGIE